MNFFGPSKWLGAFVMVLISPFTSAKVDSEKILGSGSSFIYPAMTAWTREYNKNNDVNIEYQLKRSGDGVQDMLSNDVHFAASGFAMPRKEARKIDGGVVTLPVAASKVVLSYNLDNIDDLRLSRDVYVDIFLGNITRWNDERIAEDNPKVMLPDLGITVITRSDSSGTTYAFSNHLSQISAQWKEIVGKGDLIDWPDSKQFVSTVRNDGVAVSILQTPGAIGYLESGYAHITSQKTALLENKQGKFVYANKESGEAALKDIHLSDNLVTFIPDPSGDNAYPITTFSWVILYKNNRGTHTSDVIKGFAKYIITDGQDASENMGYIRLPNHLQSQLLDAINTIN
ncbi:phosphate ABC transporter substrate-binding protein PstS [Vibrio sp.]|nr:phosphate ABC transporter substrate-binding protein PstS [Vibrio sp.]